ncbi:MAG TPA: glutathione S-transferase family protein [Candidatus Binatia bacterium]|jgi:glutathione S-transferase/RNA polymerase-associated protein
MLKLFEHPLSPYVQKVKLALLEKNLPFETAVPDIFAGGGAEFAAANPRLEIPALVDGDVKIFDSTIILEYLEDKWPQPPMLPSTPAERARVRMIEEICDTYYEAINWALYEIRFFKRATGALADTLMARAGEQIAGVNTRLERELGGREYFNGSAVGWGDISVLPAVNAAALSGFPPQAGSALERWLDRMRQRPSVQKVLTSAAESMAGFEMLPQLVESGQFVREYRDHRVEWMLRSGGVQIVLDGISKRNIRFSVELA